MPLCLREVTDIFLPSYSFSKCPFVSKLSDKQHSVKIMNTNTVTSCFMVNLSFYDPVFLFLCFSLWKSVRRYLQLDNEIDLNCQGKHKEQEKEQYKFWTVKRSIFRTELIRLIRSILQSILNKMRSFFEKTTLLRDQ